MSALHRVPAGDDGDRLAVRWHAPEGASLAFLYLHGFGSSQDGEKGAWFRRAAAEAGIAFCSFDFRGHGESGGSLTDLRLSRVLEDGEAVLAWLAERWSGPVAFFGSSMGGAAALWLAARHPSRFAAGLAIAPALGMRKALARRIGDRAMVDWQSSGRLPFRNELVETELDWDLMEDLARYPAADLPRRFRTPALVFQGLRDESVDTATVLDFVTACRGNPVELHLFADGDHRLVDRRHRLWHLALEFLAGRGLVAAPPATP